MTTSLKASNTSHYARKKQLRARLAKRLGLPPKTPWPLFPAPWTRTSGAPARNW